jgi:hypothetical protein
MLERGRETKNPLEGDRSRPSVSRRDHFWAGAGSGLAPAAGVWGPSRRATDARGQQDKGSQ